MLILLAFLGFVLFGQGIVNTIRGISIISKWQRSQSWQKVEGEIVRSEISGIRHAPQGPKSHESVMLRYLPKIEYEYSVHLVSYKSKQLYWVQNLSKGTLEKADKFISQFPLGKKVFVYYNPDKPQESVLDPYKSGSVFREFFFGMIPLFVGGFILLMSFFS